MKRGINTLCLFPFNSVMGVQMRIFFLVMVMNPSATEEVKKNLKGTVGGSITLPDPVMETGVASFGAKTIAMVTERKSKIFLDRVLWDSNTGLFTITGLQRKDSGIYNIDSTEGEVFLTSYKLTVYESVPTPAVIILSVSAESCTLLCSVEESEETTLSWYRNEEILNLNSSALSLPLTVHKHDFSSSYRCEAANPAENKTQPVNVTTSCREQDSPVVRDNQRYYMVAIPIVAVVIIVLVACIIKSKYSDQNKRTTRQSQDSDNRDVLYTDILQPEDRRSQEVHSPDSSGITDGPDLTTVYSKLEAHRMGPVPVDTGPVYDQMNFS